MERQNDGHEELIRSQQRQIDKLSGLSRTQEQKIRDLQERFSQIQEHTRRLQESFDTISNAECWKITKPVRVVLDALKAMFRYIKNKLKSWSRHRVETKTEEVQDFHDVGVYAVGAPIAVLCTKHTLFVARLTAHALERLGIPARILTEEPEVYSDQLHIVICPQMFRRMPDRYIAFQMEQTVSSRWLTDEYFDRLSRAYAVLDYSLVNVTYFKQKISFGKNFYYLPIDYLPSLKRTDDRYEYDVLFYGDADNPRRQRILTELKKRFSVKVVSEVFGEELYQLLGRAKVVVNIHYYEHAILETTRLYEVLSLGRSVVVSERSGDPEEEKRLEGIVDFVAVNDTDALMKRIEYWLSHETERAGAVEKNHQSLARRSNAFDFFFYRFFLAQDWISFDRFYELAGDFVTFTGDRICLSLPETVERRQTFDRDNRYGFEVIPGLRHKRNWTGCGLSYKYIMKRAKDQGLEKILVCEDDVLFPVDFEKKWEGCLKYLEQQQDWEVFQGFMADVGHVNISRVEQWYGQTFVHLNRMISLVLNCYNSGVYDSVIAWDESDPDMERNAIDRYLEAKNLNIVTTVPFVVGHKEELDSTIWDFNNSHYLPQISDSLRKMENLVRQHGDLEMRISTEQIGSLKETPLVSIIIAAKSLKERGSYLEKALESLCSQVYRGVEAILVADLSDIVSTNDIAERYADRLAIRIVPLERETTDIRTYRCEGVSASRGSLLGFLEQEDTLTPNCLFYILDAYP